MTPLSDVENLVLRDINVDGDVRDEPAWRELVGADEEGDSGEA